MLESVCLPAFLPDGWRSLPFRPFRDGVEISVIRDGRPMVALLRYAPRASVPRHSHTGLETVLVLEGAQSDERCTVLIQWERPMDFVVPD